MTIKSLEDLLQSVKSPVDLLRNSQSGPNVYPVVPPEYTNWRDEQRAWQETCVLFNQSYHMTDMYVEGPDALKLLSNLGINSFKGFEPNKAKQYVPCNYDGYVIGDVVLTYLSRDRLNLIGRPAIFDFPVGRGHVVAFNFNPLDRDLNRGDQRLVWNAIINWQAIVAGFPARN